jgi:hypothetical protein
MGNPVDGAHPDRQAGIVEHLCRRPGCGRWGAWGYDGGDGVSAWWCLEHRPHADPVEPMPQQGNWVSDGNEG